MVSLARLFCRATRRPLPSSGNRSLSYLIISISAARPVEGVAPDEFPTSPLCSEPFCVLVPLVASVSLYVCHPHLTFSGSLEACPPAHATETRVGQREVWWGLETGLETAVFGRGGVTGRVLRNLRDGEKAECYEHVLRYMGTATTAGFGPATGDSHRCTSPPPHYNPPPPVPSPHTTVVGSAAAYIQTTVAAVCAVCCVAVFVECAATDWGGDTVLLVTVSASCPLTGLLWERRCLVSAAPAVRAPCVRYPTRYYY